MKESKTFIKKFHRQNEMVRIKIHHLREQRGTDLRHLANFLGIAISTYLLMENGITQIYLERLYKLAEYYDIPITEFFQNEQYLSQAMDRITLEERIAQKDEEIFNLRIKLIEITRDGV